MIHLFHKKMYVAITIFFLSCLSVIGNSVTDQSCVRNFSCRVMNKQKKTQSDSSDNDTTINNQRYQTLLHKAFYQQRILDSLTWILRQKRQAIWNSSQEVIDAERKTEIDQLQKRIDTLQSHLTNYYAKAYQYERSQQKMNQTNYPDSATIHLSDSGNRFKILSQSPYSLSKPIPSDVQLPDGIAYRIQLGAYTQDIAPDAFKGISPVTSENIKGSQLTHYYAGIFTQIEAAREALKKVHNQGFKDAYIIGYLNGKQIPVDRAKKME